ncbi:MAG: 5'/3'-nucleotidase SurE [Bacteroidales bacterium]|jgi:5'-nucleotidase
MAIKEILLTNDDGIAAKGINEISQLLREYGNVTVVAPKEPQSGKSVALTLDFPLRLKKIKEENEDGILHEIRYYALTGTPADCVKMGVNLFISEGKMPDLLIAGVNHGSNASIASVYSGTLGAATEGTIYRIPSIGLSICTHDLNADFEGVKYYTRIILEKYFNNQPAKGIYLNINFPNLPKDKIKGIKITHQGDGQWVKEFEKRIDPHGMDYFWMTGEFKNHENGESDGDHTMNALGYISIVPHKIDNTDYNEVERLKKIWSF